MLFTFEFGLFFWSAVIWIVVLILLRMYAWTPLLAFIDQQEQAYVKVAQEAKNQLKLVHSLEQQSKTILQSAHVEKQKILEETLTQKKHLLQKAQQQAIEIHEKMIAEAQKDISQEKRAMMQTLKEHVGMLSIQLAEKLLKRELSEHNKQHVLLQTLINQAATSSSQ